MHKERGKIHTDRDRERKRELSRERQQENPTRKREKMRCFCLRRCYFQTLKRSSVQTFKRQFQKFINEADRTSIIISVLKPKDETEKKYDTAKHTFPTALTQPDNHRTVT